ncbi:hypothetical protein CAL14_18415 [Bordetella genomosp. 9]|uniref:hypothetical protein n=1 Tax=Bordetella genomosp. 9 TaxID=1416803 RepID=UPI000A29387C|nr:hypothetical protein [Bordetella genomosp. 9]ARP92010.1 hypothetical protein CAL14_18415 [Bordetella genomosp. 9]
MLHLDYHGDLTATRGLIRQEDREALAAKLRSNAQDEGSEIAAVDLPPVKTRPVHSEALTNRLQAQRVIALQAEIIQRPNLALCLFIEQLLAEVGDSMDRAYQTRSFDFSATSAHHDLERTDAAMEGAVAWETVQKEMESHTRDVPGDRQAVLPWLLERAQVDNLGLLAALLAATVYRVRGYNNTPYTRHLDRLAGLVGLDMSKWWSPSVQSYLGHVSKDRIAAVVAEAVGESEAKQLLSMKKGEAAAAAERLLDGKGWVPELMRARGIQADDSGDRDSDQGVDEGPDAE